MNLDLINTKLQIIESLYRIGFQKEFIIVVMHRIEIFDEDIGLALFNAFVSWEAAKESRENKVNVA